MIWKTCTPPTQCLKYLWYPHSPNAQCLWIYCYSILLHTSFLVPLDGLIHSSPDSFTFGFSLKEGHLKVWAQGSRTLGESTHIKPFTITSIRCCSCTLQDKTTSLAAFSKPCGWSSYNRNVMRQHCWGEVFGHVLGILVFSKPHIFKL